MKRIESFLNDENRNVYNPKGYELVHPKLTGYIHVCALKFENVIFIVLIEKLKIKADAKKGNDKAEQVSLNMSI